MGDFNAVLSQEDRLIRRHVQGGEIKDFRECLIDCNLAEVPSVGRQYTWTNGHVYSRINRAIANAEWMVQMTPR